MRRSQDFSPVSICFPEIVDFRDCPGFAAMSRADFLVVDSGGFIKNAPVEICILRTVTLPHYQLT